MFFIYHIFSLKGLLKAGPYFLGNFKMEEYKELQEFVSIRIGQLRNEKNITARELSLSLGFSSGDINRIENKRALPSLDALYWICDYFGITPEEFFDDGFKNPELIQKAVCGLKELSDEDVLLILNLINRMQKK